MTGLSYRLAGYTTPFWSLLTRVWKLVIMPSRCLSLALFCSPESNIPRILWTFRFRFNASEACWTVLVACTNYNSNAVSLPVCSAVLSCFHVRVACVFVHLCVCAVPSENPDQPLMFPSFILISHAEPVTFLQEICKLPSPYVSSKEITLSGLFIQPKCNLFQ